MTNQNTTIRPGLLVSLATRVEGNVKVNKLSETEKFTGTGEHITTRETERIIFDPTEHDAAIKLRGKCRSLIVAECIPLPSFNAMLCLESNRDKLTNAITEARSLADTFNRSAKLTTVKIYTVTGEVKGDDAEAIRSINSEVNGLLATMEAGLRDVNPQTVKDSIDNLRDAANKARKIAALLPNDSAERITQAIDIARKAAREAIKACETGKLEVDTLAISRITESRTMFLDLDTPTADIAAPTAEGRALDLAAEPASEPEETPPASLALPPVIAPRFEF